MSIVPTTVEPFFTVHVNVRTFAFDTCEPAIVTDRATESELRTCETFLTVISAPASVANVAPNDVPFELAAYPPTKREVAPAPARNFTGGEVTLTLSVLVDA